MVEMRSKYNTVLKEHLKRVKHSTCKLKASASHAASKTQNVFTNVVANHGEELHAVDRNSAKYFGIRFDSKRDISHADQMSRLKRYVKNHKMKVGVRKI